MSKKIIEEVVDDVVVSLDYTLKVDGEIFDNTDDEEGPIIFLQGHENIIPGLEKAIYGMKVGEGKKVIVTPEEGYGMPDPENIQKIPIDEFPADMPLKKGEYLEIKDEDGEEFYALITEVYSDKVKLDFNDPLAGKTLEFYVTITELREASPEEVEHGHINFDEE